jgi:hypothetical protein
MALNEFIQQRPLLKTKHEFRSNFPLYQDSIAYNPQETYNGIVSNIVENNPLNNMFFSQQNIDILQKAIRLHVYSKSHKKFSVDLQSKDELLLLMRGIYLQYSKNQDAKLNEQVKELDKLVINEAVPIILSNVELHYSYLYDLSEPRFMRPIDRAKNVSSKGERTVIGSASRLL